MTGRPPPKVPTLTKRAHYGVFFPYKSELQGQTIWTLIPNSYNKVGRGQVLSCLAHFA